MSRFSLNANNNKDISYFQSLDKVRQSKEYKQNEIQINFISKILVEHADVPSELIDLLIECVQENVALEYENSKL